ncbi:MAG: phosphosulfolactate synthase [Bacteroidota bacterium]
MNYTLPFIPSRPEKPRESGITMVMDKGLSLRECENMVSAGGYIADFVKFGFGTSAVVGSLEDKVKVFHRAGIRVYLGGTLFEAFVIRGMFDDYVKLAKRLKLETVEVSDGSMKMEHSQKCEYIKKLAQDFTVLSEVGSKDENVHLSTAEWINGMKSELEAGAFKVIAEAREGGNVGIFNSAGKAESELIDEIIAKVGADSVLWETPLKSQQVWFIKKIGANANLGNVAPNELIALEALRLGLRGDTFFEYLPEELKKNKI